MFELGRTSEKEHLKIIRFLQEYGFQNVFLIGKYFHMVSKNTNYKRFENTDEFITYVKSVKIVDCYILIKGSRGMLLEKNHKLFINIYLEKYLSLFNS